MTQAEMGVDHADRIAELIEKTTAARGIDYWAVEEQQYTASEWADKTGRDQSTVSRNVQRARDNLPFCTIIQTIKVDLDDLIDQLERAVDPKLDSTREKYLMRIHPPFEPVVECRSFTTQEGNSYPPEMEPKPIHIKPEEFIHINKLIEYPYNRRENLRFAGFNPDEVSDEKGNKLHEQALTVWRDDVRKDSRRKDVINLGSPVDSDSPTNVEYVEDDGEDR